MKLKSFFVYLFALSFISLPALAQTQLADIGFKGFNYYIAVEPSLQGQDEVYRFSLRNTSTDLSAEISSCVYSKQTLENQIKSSAEFSESPELEWFFYRSDYSIVSFEKFYSTLGKLFAKVST